MKKLGGWVVPTLLASPTPNTFHNTPRTLQLYLSRNLQIISNRFSYILSSIEAMDALMSCPSLSLEFRRLSILAASFSCTYFLLLLDCPTFWSIKHDFLMEEIDLLQPFVTCWFVTFSYMMIHGHICKKSHCFTPHWGWILCLTFHCVIFCSRRRKIWMRRP